MRVPGSNEERMPSGTRPEAGESQRPSERLRAACSVQNICSNYRHFQAHVNTFAAKMAHFKESAQMRGQRRHAYAGRDTSGGRWPLGVQQGFEGKDSEVMDGGDGRASQA